MKRGQECKRRRRRNELSSSCQQRYIYAAINSIKQPLQQNDHCPVLLVMTMMMTRLDVAAAEALVPAAVVTAPKGE